MQDPTAIASFYRHPAPPDAGTACRGLACFAARNDRPSRWARACSREPGVECLGLCHDAPAAAGASPPPEVRSASPESVLLGGILAGGGAGLAAHRARGGGRAIERARGMSEAELVALVSASGLRGRGGSGFPAGRKWEAVRAAARDGRRPVLVVNADEGDAGAFGDKVLLERDPFRLLEGIAIAARGVGAPEAVIYLRREYPDAERVLRGALAEWRAGDGAGGPGVELVVGGGSYVCGEETALLAALEGRRPFARARPPHPAERGLHGRPTLVHNVETLCALPWIVLAGAEAHRRLGAGASAGTKLVSLCSLFRRPGLVEVPFGIPLRTIVEEIGGGLRRGRLRGLLVGGPLAGLLPPDRLDLPFTHEALAAEGCAVGHGGIVAFADDTSIAEIVAEVFRFGAAESCGLCTPCRVGAAAIADGFASPGARGVPPGAPGWREIVASLGETSVCGLGSGLAEFARSIERHHGAALAKALA